MSRKADYALVALKALDGLGEHGSLSARELARRCQLPADLTAKVLATLAHAGLVEASMGKHGGYRLARDAAKITVAEVVRVVEGEAQLAPCQEGASQCQRFQACDIRSPLAVLERAVMNVLDGMTIAQL